MISAEELPQGYRAVAYPRTFLTISLSDAHIPWTSVGHDNFALSELTLARTPSTYIIPEKRRARGRWGTTLEVELMVTTVYKLHQASALTIYQVQKKTWTISVQGFYNANLLKEYPIRDMIMTKYKVQCRAKIEHA